MIGNAPDDPEEAELRLFLTVRNRIGLGLPVKANYLEFSPAEAIELGNKLVQFGRAAMESTVPPKNLS